MYQSKVYVQGFLYFVPGLDIQPELSKNDNLQAKSGCRLLNSLTNIQFYSSDWHKPMA